MVLGKKRVVVRQNKREIIRMVGKEKNIKGTEGR